MTTNQAVISQRRLVPERRPITALFRRLSKRASTAIACADAIGVRPGLRLALQALVAENGHGEFAALSVPGLDRKLRLRRSSSDIKTFLQVFASREYDFSEMPHAWRIMSIDPHKVRIIDCGANVGCSVAWFAAVFPGSTIIAVEPEPENVKLLKLNVGDLASVVQAAVWFETTTVVIRDANAESWAFRVEHTTNTPDSTAIRTVTLNSTVPIQQSEHCTIVKVDIEGAEKELFSQNVEWIDRVDLLIIELHDWLLPGARTSTNVLRCLADRSFEYFWRGENLFCFKVD